MIIQNPNIKGGEPHIKNTRLTVSEILSAIASGLSINDIIKRCKIAGVIINKKDIIDAIYFASSKITNQYE